MIGAAKINFISKFTSTAVAEVIRKKKAITAVGDAQIDTAQSKFGGSSMLFDGTGDYLNVATDTAFTMSGDFTVELWYRASATNGALLPFFNTADHLFYIGYSGGNPVYDVFSGGSNRTTLTAISGWALNTWYHVAFVRSGSTIKIYHNGTQATSGTWSATVNTGNPNQIGIYSSYLFQGHMDELRVSNTARYTANFTAPTTPFVNDDNTVLLIHANGSDAVKFFEDDNGVRDQKGIIALGNAQIDTAQSKFGGSSALFDGTGDYLQFAHSITASENFTFEGWIRFNTIPTSGTYEFLAGNTAGNNRYFGYNNSGGTLRFETGVTGTSGSFYQWWNTTLTTGTWYHIAFVKSSTSLAVYVNGTAVTSSGTSGSMTADKHLFYQGDGLIGAWSTLTNYFNGWMDEVRVSNTARYTGNFAAPTTPFTNDANTLLLIHADGTDGSTVFRDDNGAIAPATPVYNNDGYASYLKLAVPFSSTVDDVAYSIAGTGLSVAATNTQGTSSTISGGGAFGEYASSLLNSQTGQSLTYALPTSIPSSSSGTFVIEGWFAASDVTTNNNWVISSADSGGRFLFGFNTGSTFTFATENNIGIGTGWHHIAIVCDSGTKRFYYDGIYKGAWASGNTGFSTLHIGQFTSGDANDYRGRIQDLRVYVGTNKGYTGTNSGAANFGLPNPIINIRKQKAIQAVGNAQVSTAQSKFGGTSLLVDGTGDYITVANSNDFNFGSSDFTIEFWVRAANFTSSPGVMGMATVGQVGGWNFQFGTDGKLYLEFSANGTSVSTTAVTTASSTNTWYHMAFVRSGNTIYAYKDGVNGTSYSFSGSFVASTANLIIGDGYGIATTWTAGQDFNGNIDEVRISNIARYTANFTSPTAPFQNDSNTVLLIHADGTNASTVFFDDNGRTTTP